MANPIFVCKHCGNIVELVFNGRGQLVCCGEPMTRQEEKTADSATEKHVPVIEKTTNGYRVTVGSVAHPMLDNHYILFIELIADGVSYKKFLKPGDAPTAEFCVKADSVQAREYCNVHGLWKS